MISSLDAVRAISRERGDAVVVSTMTPNRYWESVSENRDLDLPIFGAMGKASSVALGIALAQPDKKIIILDSDGGLLMNLGSLITLAGPRPKTSSTSCSRTEPTSPPEANQFLERGGSTSQPWLVTPDSPPPTSSTTWKKWQATSHK